MPTDEKALQRLLKRPWILSWLRLLQGQPGIEQTMGFWLAAQADEHGVIDAVDWARLVADTGLSDTAVRKALRPGGRLVLNGLVERERTYANGSRAPGPTRYTLVLE